jgi:UDP-glucuronate 4-epimerase
MMARILITGMAGFIGFHLAKALAQAHPAATIVGVDNLNDYYDPALKNARLSALQPFPTITFHRLDVSDAKALSWLWQDVKPTHVYHLAAQAGVRYSLKNPQAYVDSNITGFLNVLEACRRLPPQHLLYASSSSVYGLNRETPFSEHQLTDAPASLYGATKKANELMAHSYAHLFAFPCTALRFFTVYGAWGRPDMAYFSFLKAMLAGQPIDVYNNGNLQRDFTYINDVIAALLRLLNAPPSATPPHQVLNIGNNQPVALLDFIQALENASGLSAALRFLPMQAGDVHATWANTTALEQLTGAAAHTPLLDGLKTFVQWYREQYPQETS